MEFVWLIVLVVVAGSLAAGFFLWQKSRRGKLVVNSAAKNRESAEEKITKKLEMNNTTFDIDGSLDEFTITVDGRYVFSCKNGIIIASGDKSKGNHLQSYLGV